MFLIVAPPVVGSPAEDGLLTRRLYGISSVADEEKKAPKSVGGSKYVTSRSNSEWAGVVKPRDSKDGPQVRSGTSEDCRREDRGFQ